MCSEVKGNVNENPKDSSGNPQTSHYVKAENQAGSSISAVTKDKTPPQKLQDNEHIEPVISTSTEHLHGPIEETHPSTGPTTPTKQLVRETVQSQVNPIFKAEATTSSTSSAHPTNSLSQDPQDQQTDSGGHHAAMNPPRPIEDNNDANESPLTERELEQLNDEEHGSGERREEDGDEYLHYLDSLTASQLLPESLMRDYLPMPPAL